MTEPAGESTYRVWSCGRCRNAYKTIPASQETGCRCPEPIPTLSPTYVTVMASAPRRKLHPAGPQDEIRARFARRGKRVSVTVTGTVTDAWLANGDLWMIVDTDDRRRITVRPSAGDALTEADPTT